MSNQYYNFTDPAKSGTIVDPFDYNREMEKITDAFSVVPPASQLTSGTLNYSSDTGSGNNYVATLDDFDTDYVTGGNVALKVGSTSTGQSTLSVNGLAAKNVTLPVFGNVASGDLFAGGIYTFVYNGDNFQVLEMGARYYTTAFEQLSIAQAAVTVAANGSTSAGSSRDAAAVSATNAVGYATTVTNSKNATASSASSAATQATNAASSASAANTSNTAATNSATGAANSETAAASSATAAANSATAANNSATAAASSATAAANSASSAAASATTAVNITNASDFGSRVRSAILELELFPGCVEFFAADINPNTTYPGTTWVRLPESTSIRLSDANGSDALASTGVDTVTLTASTMTSHTHTPTLSAVSTTDIGNKTTSSFDYGTDTLANFTDSTKTSSTFDYGTKTSSSYDFAAATTNSTGAHTHTVPTSNGSNEGGKVPLTSGRVATQYTSANTGSAGAHTHTFDMGAHSHTVGLGSHSHTYALGSHTHTVALGAHTQTVALGSHNHSASTTVSSVGSGTAFSVVESSLILVAWYRSA